MLFFEREEQMIGIEIVKELSSYAGAILTIISLSALLIKPLRQKIVSWISKTSDRDNINEKIDNLTNLVQTTIAQNDELQTEMIKQSKALQANLRNTILDMYDRCTSRGHITTYELQNLSQLYENYTALGGNSFVKDCVDRLRALEIGND